MHRAIVVRGALVDCDAPVHPWTETGLGFVTRAVRRETRIVFNHWTASENPIASIIRNMTAVRHSAHFVVMYDGKIYQTADAAAVCAHVQGFNDVSVGIEYQNRGHGLRLPDKGNVRALVHETVNGERIKYGLMTPAQIASGIALNAALCRAYRLPPVLPLDARTGGIYASELPEALKLRYRGIAGHYHFRGDKVDPALDLLRRIQAALDPPVPPLVS